MATTSIEEAAAIIGGRTPEGAPIPFNIDYVTCDIYWYKAREVKKYWH